MAGYTCIYLCVVVLGSAVLLHLVLVVAYNDIDDDAAGATRDRAALVSFMSSIVDDPQGALGSWNSTTLHFCNWTGVYCNRTKGRVVWLRLSGRSLSGTISPALSDLSLLSVLDLSENFLRGRIPAELGSLTQLTMLSVATNALEGAIPAELGSMWQLIYLNMADNRLDGRIPETMLCNWSSLQYMDLSNNSLVGPIPLNNNCHLPELRFLLLWSNSLSGPIPPALSNSSKLRWIELGSNRISGELPSAMLENMPSLEVLYLSYNNLSSHDRNTDLAPFFVSLSSCRHLKELRLAGNGLGGVIPPAIGNLSTNLSHLHLVENLIRGPIPPNISNLFNLTYLNLSNNLLTGSIPPDLAKLKRLERIILTNNMLSGEIPPVLGDIPQLGELDLSGNKLSGSIPGSLSNLTQLRELLLHRNNLSGTIPPSIGNCNNLEILDLSHNMLNGRIPNEVAGLGNLKLYMNLSNNHLEGPVPLELSKMEMVIALDLSSNNLSGMISPQLGSCIALKYLNLSGNNLDGPLPSSIGGLPNLEELDLSMNKLVGTLPESLLASSTLKMLNVSFNKFSGVVTHEGVFASLTVNSFLGNSGLCGPVPGMRSCETKHSHRHILLPLLVALFGTPCMLLCLFGYRIIGGSRGSRLKLFGGSTSEDAEQGRQDCDYPRISYRQLAEATGGFDPSNLVGAGNFGRVYKGVLWDQTRIAVKVLDPKGGGEISGSFKRECEVLKRTRHRNLIRIVTTCSKPDFKALVLPLMSNGSLESYLYARDSNSGSCQRLNLIQLVNISSDIAEGMAYMHHYSPVGVIHCDLKPSNVLLDTDLTAIVSDFGISRLVRGGADGAADPTSGSSLTGLLCGSVGYIAPEYGVGGRPSTQGDVYSFGVLLLEMITGKRPTDVIFKEGSTLQEWVRGHYPHDLEAIVQQPLFRALPSAADAVAYHDKVWMDVVMELIELGLVCTQIAPSLRPTMINVAHDIGQLKEGLSRMASQSDESSTSVPNSSF